MMDQEAIFAIDVGNLDYAVGSGITLPYHVKHNVFLASWHIYLFSQ